MRPTLQQLSATPSRFLPTDLRRPPVPVALPSRAAVPIPADFICPVNLTLMADPVVASDGHTYEREAIQEWLGTGSMLSPKTNEPLAHTHLTANHATHGAIAELETQVITKYGNKGGTKSEQGKSPELVHLESMGFPPAIAIAAATGAASIEDAIQAALALS